MYLLYTFISNTNISFVVYFIFTSILCAMLTNQTLDISSCICHNVKSMSVVVTFVMVILVINFLIIREYKIVCYNQFLFLIAKTDIRIDLCAKQYPTFRPHCLLTFFIFLSIPTIFE